MFHAKDGLFFEGDRDGNVVVELHDKASYEATQISRIELTPNEWASVVASVSKRGETSATWNEAMNYHLAKMPFVQHVRS
jgi:hypothetical protein